jgi:hypothetical protein
MDEIINGFPAYIYPIGMLFQFFLFPLITTFCSISTFNTIFILYLAKDYFFPMDYILSAHHVICITYTWIFSKTKGDTKATTICEIGSGACNVYVFTRHYNYHVTEIHAFYFIVMTLSNIYALHDVFHSNKPLFFKLTMLVLVIGREYFIFL